MRELIERLRAAAPDAVLLENEPMKNHTTFRIGGPADAVFFPTDAEQVRRALGEAAALGVPAFVMGNGSNLLVRDGGVRGLVVILGEGMSDIARRGNTLTAQAGCPLSRLSKRAQAEGLAGLAFAAGIPGSVGGAVAMNAGAYGGEIGQTLSRALTLARDGSMAWMSRDELSLAYRDSAVLRRNLIVLEAEFALAEGDPAAILEEMNEYNRRRREKQPLNMPSAGSTFKRPLGYYAGALIEAAGLKGASVGGAQVSEKHAGFIVNTGSATARDVLSLIRYVQEKVYENSGVNLETEIRTIGEEQAR